ncbi:unnamed protein product [Sphenostylis stenocarpa]|uniref:Uncharacterized protein n=1 Tax=Sphenostylis stenocarpa TaxID=92480 RepID=A0AA86SI23_9FABA|nr:unnamed protein product [Sphenostylis stenocarpa]
MQMAILLRGGALGDSSFRLCSLPSTSYVSQNVAIPTSSSSSSPPSLPLIAIKYKSASRHRITCSAVQESSPSTAATAETKEEVKETPKAAPAKIPPAKAQVKPLPQMMEDDVIPSLKAIFEAQEDFSNIELVFKDNKRLKQKKKDLVKNQVLRIGFDDYEPHDPCENERECSKPHGNAQHMQMRSQNIVHPEALTELISPELRSNPQPAKDNKSFFNAHLVKCE